jgi:protein involved in polysaccharide export with SLBB domain
MQARHNLKSLVVLLILAQAIAFSQTGMGGLQTSGGGLGEQLLMQNMMGGMQQGGMQQMGGVQPSMAELFYIQQMMGQERRRGSNTSMFQMNDTTNLFLSPDSALGMPSLLMDTLSYVMAIDTIPIDSLPFYNDIEELRKMTPDGKKRIVLRKKRVPRSTVLRRYESDFFKAANPSIFSNTTSGVGGDYPIKPGDELVLTIWGAVEKESRLQVNNQGKISVESVGLVSLNGVTLSEAEGILKTKLSKVYSGIKSGQTFVNLRFELLSPVKVFLLGEVEKPGAYVFFGNTTVFQALYISGGPNQNGSVRYVQIARKDSIFSVDLYDYLMYGKNTTRATLFDGDIVFLPRAKILAEVDGAVGRPAIYEMKEGEGVAQLLSFAGGINPDAAEQNMILTRIYPNGRKDYETILKPSDYISGKESLPLKNGDALQVFRSVEKSMFNATILGAVKYPGTYQLKDSMTATNLVEVSGGLLESGFSGRVHLLRAIPHGGYQLFSQNLEDEKSINVRPRDTLVVYNLKDMFRPDSVSIGGAVLNPGYYQYYEGMDAKDLVLLAGGYLANSKRSSLSIGRLEADRRTVNVTTHSVNQNYDSYKNEELKLQAWDHIEVPYDSSFYRPELVVLSGAFKRPGVYSLSYPDETLENLIRRAGGFLDEAYLDGARFYRRSMFENDTTKTDSTLGLVGIDISRVLKKETRNNINLMNGDSIHIPQRAISVRVWGHVGATTNVLWKKGASVGWYLSQAGGVAIDGDGARALIRYANGSVALASEAERGPDPGSEIFVPYKKPPEPVVWTQVVTAFGTIAQAMSTLLLTYIAFSK